jgi:hypothetical protein
MFTFLMILNLYSHNPLGSYRVYETNISRPISSENIKFIIQYFSHISEITVNKNLCITYN